MKKGKKLKCIILIIVLGILVSILSFLLFAREDKEIERFESEFGVNLPKETKVIFSEDTHGAMGDGVSLYVYQINPTDMTELIRQIKLRWYHLPIKETMLNQLSKFVYGVSSPEITKAMDLDSKTGFFYIKNRYNIPLKGYDFKDISYNNIIIGIVDFQNNKIYYYTSDK